MTRPFRLGIIRARTDGRAPIPDDLLLDFLVDHPRSLLAYWGDITDGWLDFGRPTVFPWVDITITDPSERAAIGASAMAAVRAAAAGADPLAGLDGVLVVVHPGTPGVNAGSVSGSPPFSVVTSSGDMTFLAHELGHTLGTDHSFGLDCSGIDYAGTGAVSPEYGSPYDLMSSATFGTRSRPGGGEPFYFANPTSDGPAGTSWPGRTRTGPALARAHLWQWMPEAMAGRVAVLGRQPSPQGHRLHAAGTGGGGTSLLVVPSLYDQANGIGETYVEYRLGRGWDAGIGGPDSGLARQGVVVHTSELMNEHPVAWYRGSVRDVPGTGETAATHDVSVSVRDRGEDADGPWVDVELVVDPVPLATLEVEESSELVLAFGDITLGTTPCGDRTEKGTWLMTGSFRCRVECPPGTPLGEVGAPVSWWLGEVPLTAPSAEGFAVIADDGSSYAVSYHIDPTSHDLTIDTGLGDAYTLGVSGVASLGGEAVTARRRVTAAGAWTGLHPDSLAALGHCLAELAHETVGIDVLDVESLTDRHEVHAWRELEKAVNGAIATLPGVVAAGFRESAGLQIDFQVPAWTLDVPG